MRSSVSVALIIAGTMLIITPYINNGLAVNRVADVLSNLQRTVNLRGSMPPWYDSGCFVLGAVMIVTSVAGAMMRRDEKRE